MYICVTQVFADICSEDWVRERFLQDPQALLKRGELTDRFLEPEGVRNPSSMSRLV